MFWFVMTWVFAAAHVVLWAMYRGKCQELEWRHADVTRHAGYWYDACDQRDRIRKELEHIQEAHDKHAQNALIYKNQIDNLRSHIIELKRDLEESTRQLEHVMQHKSKLSEEVSNLRKEVERLQQRRPSNKELDEHRKEALSRIAKQVGKPLTEIVRWIGGNGWLVEGSKELRDAIESVSGTACRINDEEEFV